MAECLGPESVALRPEPGQLEDSHADHEPPQVAAQDGADLDADRLVGPRPGR
jgi:hypothetical protein